MYRLRPFLELALPKKNSPPKWGAEKPEKNEAPKGASSQGSELEGGLHKTAEGISISAFRVSTEDCRSDGDVVGNGH